MVSKIQENENLENEIEIIHIKDKSKGGMSPMTQFLKKSEDQMLRQVWKRA